MKKAKRFFSAVLTFCLLVSALALPASATGISTFDDVTDVNVGQAVEVLRIMGVVDGVGDGRFNPSGTLTRAEFCKMAILVMGLGGDVAAHESRTIFSDVASNHWARGYINLAVTVDVDGSRLILGVGEGKFEPSRTITYAEAVTVLERILGYGAEANVNWPYGAVGAASSIGLDSGLGSVTATGTITRAQAALLFANMLTAHTSGSQSPYVSTLGSVTEGAILLSLDGKTADGSDGVSFSLMEAPVKPAHAMPGSFLLGRRGAAVLDSRGMLLTFIPDKDVTARTVTVELTSPTSITGADGTKLSVPSAATVLRDGKEYAYGEVYRGLNVPGLVLTVYYNASGAVDYIFVGGTPTSFGAAFVAREDGAGAFDAITDASRTCSVIKNGAASTLSQLKKYDVGVYSAGSDTLYVTDFRLSGLYESADPNPYAPTSITFMGRSFEVLESAIPYFENVQPKTVVTLLFSPDGKVAGITPLNTVGSNAIGVLTPDSTGSTVSVELLNSPLAPGEGEARPVLTGTIGGATPAENYFGKVVTVSGSTARVDGKTVPVWYLSRLTGVSGGLLDVAERTVGGAAIADNAVIFEKVGNSDITLISLSDIAAPTVPESKVIFTHKDAAGKADVLILNDVTGDRYYYGFISESEIEVQDWDSMTGGGQIFNTVTTVTYGDGEDDRVSVIGSYVTDSPFGGVAVSLSKIGGVPSCSAFASLSRIEGITQANFSASRDALTYGSAVIPIAENVRCYNGVTGAWFSSLEKCLVSSNSFTVYFDRSPGEGAKIRIVVAE